MASPQQKKDNLRKAYEIKLGKERVSKLSDDQIALISQRYNSSSKSEQSKIDSEIIMGKYTILHSIADGLISESEQTKRAPKPPAIKKPLPLPRKNPTQTSNQQAQQFTKITEEQKRKQQESERKQQESARRTSSALSTPQSSNVTQGPASSFFDGGFTSMNPNIRPKQKYVADPTSKIITNMQGFDIDDLRPQAESGRKRIGLDSLLGAIIPSLSKIEENMIAVVDILTKQLTLEKTKVDSERIAAENLKRKGRESDMESQTAGGGPGRIIGGLGKSIPESFKDTLKRIMIAAAGAFLINKFGEITEWLQGKVDALAEAIEKISKGDVGGGSKGIFNVIAESINETFISLTTWLDQQRIKVFRGVLDTIPALESILNSTTDIINNVLSIFGGPKLDYTRDILDRGEEALSGGNVFEIPTYGTEESSQSEDGSVPTSATIGTLPKLQIPDISDYEEEKTQPGSINQSQMYSGANPNADAGFRGGGLVTPSSGVPSRRSDGDTRRIAAQPGEVVMSRNAVDRYGKNTLLAMNNGAQRPRRMNKFPLFNIPAPGLRDVFGRPMPPVRRRSNRNYEFARAMIKQHEGSNIVNGRHVAYNDSKGFPTIGYGHLIKPGESFGNYISQKEADALFDKDFDKHLKQAMKIPGFSTATPQQQAALIDLTFNMGGSWYKGFPGFMRAFKAGDLERAAAELRDSKWFHDVKERRAVPVINLIRNKGTGGVPHLKKLTLPNSTSSSVSTTSPTIASISGATRPPQRIGQRPNRRISAVPVVVNGGGNSSASSATTPAGDVTPRFSSQDSSDEKRMSIMGIYNIG